MAQLGPPLVPAIPAVVVQVEGEGLEEEESYVDPHGDLEDLGKVDPEVGEDRDEEEGEDRPPDCRGGVRHEQQPGELLRKLIVLRIPPEHADGLGDNREHGHAEHEGREEQVDLRGDPDGHAPPNQGEVSVASAGDILRPGHLGE